MAMTSRSSGLIGQAEQRKKREAKARAAAGKAKSNAPAPVQTPTVRPQRQSTTTMPPDAPVLMPRSPRTRPAATVAVRG